MRFLGWVLLPTRTPSPWGDRATPFACLAGPRRNNGPPEKHASGGFSMQGPGTMRAPIRPAHACVRARPIR